MARDIHGLSFFFVREKNRYLYGSNIASLTKTYILKGDKIMLAAKAGIGILEKIAPKAVSALGKAGVAEVAVVAGVVAEGLNLVMTPVVEKGTQFIKSKVETAAANKKQELLNKRAALLEQKAQKANTEEAEAEAPAEEVPVEEKPKTSNKKKNK